MLGSPRLQCQHRRDRSDDLQIVKHILPESLAVPDHFLAGRVCEVVDHDAVDTRLLVQSFDHDILMNRLVFPADEIIIEVDIQIIHPLNIGKRIEHIDIIDIESVLGQLQSAVTQHLCAKDHRVHQDIFADREAVCLLPGKDPADRQTPPVFHDLVAVLVLLIIDKITDQQIQRLLLSGKAAQNIKNTLESTCADLVIAVNDLEIKSLRVLDSGVDRSSMSLVGLVDGPDNSGMLCFEPVRDLCGPVF